MKPQTFLKSGVFLVLFTLAPAASAWYQVEVIVFQYLRPNADGEEFAGDSGMPESDGAVELTATGLGDAKGPFVPYRLAPPSRYRLAGAYQSLRASHDYRPILYTAWEQPGSGEGPARAVHLAQISGAASMGAGEGADQAAAGKIVDGTVRVRSGRFLYVDVDMAWFADDAGTAAGQPAAVRLRGTRKVKLNELHYVDHPLFGVLIEVSRLRSDVPGAAGGDEPGKTGEDPVAETPED